MSVDKQTKRIRRRGRSRAHIKYLNVHRLCVHRTPRHVYAQIIVPDGSQTLISVSTLDKEVRDQVKYGGNVKAALAVGKILAERAKQAGITRVAFDRSGFKYHGRVKALADAAREHGMEF
ncbi:MAG: 50S ribosomal protein L18 [Gammaproteobacteria bacterium]